MLAKKGFQTCVPSRRELEMADLEAPILLSSRKDREAARELAHATDLYQGKGNLVQAATARASLEQINP